MRKILLTVTEELERKIRDIRRELHRRPELACQENRTAALIKKELDSLGIGYTQGLAAGMHDSVLLRGKIKTGFFLH
ncbi:MAG: hypothetical protein D3904_15455, partial [Candidatus Electrothrix sp. EH2]|nr:hypothetical protein [Candidatus Electrothrix sp. EH2]